MLDTMTITKAVGGVCGALLIFLLGNWVAESLYSVGGGHGEEHAAAYVIETDSGGGSVTRNGHGIHLRPILLRLIARRQVARLM